MKYGEVMRQQRLIQGKTMLDVQRDTGISNQNLSRWERNEVVPNIEACVTLARYYGITLEDLLGIDL
ncbi:MAG: helix-turn-helix transcriptional regulator [Clostridia bacterium]|nr:helix-turn-helix transcriptional regulator [Clostridia bacterium]